MENAFSFSIFQGVKKLEKNLFYYGHVVRVPIKYYGTEIQERAEMDNEELMMHISNRGFLPLEGAETERYETVDAVSNELLILYRVPCRLMTDEKNKKKAKIDKWNPLCQ